MLFIHETFLVYKLETFKKFKEVKYIMISIIAIIYIFFILCDISSAVTNYVQKILRTPLPPALTKSTPLFTQSPLEIQKSASLPFHHFFRSLLQKGEDTRVHRSVLRKIKTDLLFFEAFMMSIY